MHSMTYGHFAVDRNTEAQSLRPCFSVISVFQNASTADDVSAGFARARPGLPFSNGSWRLLWFIGEQKGAKDAKKRPKAVNHEILES